MHLKPKQAQRLLRIIDPLLGYCAKKLGKGDYATVDDFDPDTLFEVFEAVWAEPGGLGLIARFVSENPARLTSSDLERAACFVEGLYADFPVLRSGKTTYLMHGNRAYAVAGVFRDISDIVEDMSTYVRCVLLPFDGIITYAGRLFYDTEGMERSEELAHRAALSLALEERRVVRNAEEFLRVAPDARSLEAKRRELESEFDDEDEGGEAPAQHAGALAGLTWEDREEALENYQKENQAVFDGVLAKLLDRVCLNGSPSSSLREVLYRYSPGELRRTASELGLSQNTIFGGKRQLVSAILKAQTTDAETVMKQPVLSGAEYVRETRRLFEAGGHQMIRERDLHTREDFFWPQYPTIEVFHVKGAYHAMMSKEVMRALKGADFDGYERLAERYDRIVNYVNLAVGFRGAVVLSEVLQEVRDVLGEDMENQDIMDVLKCRAEAHVVDFIFGWLEEADITHVLLAPGAGEVDENDEVIDEDYDLVEGLLGAHEELEPRPLLDLLGTYRNLSDYVAGLEERRALARYCDSHVPEDENEYMFADVILEEILYTAQGWKDQGKVIADILGVWEGSGFVPADEQEVVTLTCLIEDYLQATPKYYLNGWAPRDIEVNEGGRQKPKVQNKAQKEEDA